MDKLSTNNDFVMVLILRKHNYEEHLTTFGTKKRIYFT